MSLPFHFDSIVDILAAAFQVVINDDKHNIHSNYGTSTHFRYAENTVYKSL